MNLYNIINFYGFKKNTKTFRYMVVMNYANRGNLRKNLTEIVNYNWKQKLNMLYKIISGLKMIHKKNLIHCDFHDGNILNHKSKYSENRIYISDLGLSQPIKSFLEKNYII